MTEPGTELVPFGKHKGRPVEALVADVGYREWLMGQPWFRDKFPTVYQTIINYAGEPAETPEHNELQASFLSDARCLALAKLLYRSNQLDGTSAVRMANPARPVYEKLSEHVRTSWGTPRTSRRTFEVDGWDVVYSIEPPWLAFELKSLPACVCGACDHEADCPGSAPCRGGDRAYDCRHRACGGRLTPTFEWRSEADERELERVADHLRTNYSNGHCNKACPWSDGDAARWLLLDEERLHEPRSVGFICVECKPDLGDDFPSVLRQVKRYERGHADQVCVLVRRHSFESVSWEQVVEIFVASRVVLIAEERLLEEEVLTTDAGEAGREEEA